MLWHVVSWFCWWNQPNPSWWKSRSFSRTSMNHNDKDQPFPAKLGHPPKQGWLRKDNSPESTPQIPWIVRFRDYSKLLRVFSEKLFQFVSASGVEFLRRGTSLVKWSFAECPSETEPSNLWIMEVVKSFFFIILSKKVLLTVKVNAYQSTGIVFWSKEMERVCGECTRNPLYLTQSGKWLARMIVGSHCLINSLPADTE